MSYFRYFLLTFALFASISKANVEVPTGANPTNQPCEIDWSQMLCCAPCPIPTCPETECPTEPPSTEAPTTTAIPSTPGAETTAAPTTKHETTEAPSTEAPTTTAIPSTPAANTTEDCPEFPLLKFNVFAFGTITLSESDFGSRCAAGNSITLTDFSIGEELPEKSVNCGDLGDVYPYSIVSGGSLNLLRGRIHGGGAVYATTSSISQVTFNEGCSAVQDENFIDFAQWKTYSVDLSRKLSELSETGSLDLSGNSLTLVGSGAQIEVFSMSAAQFSSANPIAINGIDSAQAIIINIVAGGELVMPITDWFIPFESIAEKLIINCYQTTLIRMSNIAFHGLLLAADADVVTNSGRFDGTIVCNNWNGNFQGFYREAEICPPDFVNSTESKRNVFQRLSSILG